MKQFLRVLSCCVFLLVVGSFFISTVSAQKNADDCYFKNNGQPREKSNCWWTSGCTWDANAGEENSDGACIPKGTPLGEGELPPVSDRKLEKALGLFSEMSQQPEMFFQAEAWSINPPSDLYQQHEMLSVEGFTPTEMVQFCADASDSLTTIGKGRCENIFDLLGIIGRDGVWFPAYSGPVFYGPGLKSGAHIARAQLDHSISHEKDIRVLAIGWSKFFLSIAAVVAVIALIYAGILYITDFGTGSGAEKAKKIVLWVVVGILLILGAYAIVNTVIRANMGAPDDGGEISQIEINFQEGGQQKELPDGGGSLEDPPDKPLPPWGYGKPPEQDPNGPGKNGFGFSFGFAPSELLFRRGRRSLVSI
ncbi:MAG: pilin [Candidatus Gracilibacteria bacterium]|nr:pilin [Candidatus Gracilibacteria bacterium]